MLAGVTLPTAINAAPRNSMLGLAVLGAAQALMLGIALPLFFRIGVNSDAGHHGELACYLCFLSTLGAFVLASRRPAYAALWLFVAGALCAAWTIYDLDGPFYAPMLLMPPFWWADLPLAWAILFMIAAWVLQPQQK